MGLSIAVGALADLLINDIEGAEWLKDDIIVINELLVENALPSHIEPEILPNINSRVLIQSFPYSFLHYLRRVYARVVNDAKWHPVPVVDGEDPAKDDVLDQEMCMFSSHLLCHSDCEGFYVPIAFDDIIFDERVKGGILGSSYRLHEELVFIAPSLSINLSNGLLSNTEIDSINNQVKLEQDLWIEKLVWLSLYEASRVSIEHKTLISFG